MNNIFDELIVPYKGNMSFEFGTKLNNIKALIKKEQLSSRQTERSNKGCEIDWPWILVTVENSITLVFVKEVLFEIVFENSYKGKLSNGGCLGMSLDELIKIDRTLVYNDDEDDYASAEGYWVTTDENGIVDSITIFVKEIEKTNFYKYEWLSQYM